MAFVGAPFAHDLFVSYSHGSDADGEGLLRPWSLAFVSALDKELRADRRFRNGLSLFVDADHRPDRGVDPLLGLSEQLDLQVKGSALLVVLMSPDYLASTWCRNEREAWLAGQKAHRLAPEGRVAVVRIWPTTEGWPAELCDTQGVPLVGFKFHDDADGVDRPLGWVEHPQFDTGFRRAMVGLAGRLTQHLLELQQRAEAMRLQAADAARLQAVAAQSIYLHGHAEDSAAWDRAALALSDQGYVVVPGEPDPVVATPQDVITLRKRRVGALVDADALLLLAPPDGRVLDADLLAVARHDRESARAVTRRLLPCGVLDCVGNPVATEVRRRAARNLQADWLDGTQAPWTPVVQQWLAQKGAEVEQRG